MSFHILLAKTMQRSHSCHSGINLEDKTQWGWQVSLRVCLPQRPWFITYWFSVFEFVSLGPLRFNFFKEESSRKRVRGGHWVLQPLGVQTVKFNYFSVYSALPLTPPLDSIHSLQPNSQEVFRASWNTSLSNSHQTQVANSYKLPSLFPS